MATNKQLEEQLQEMTQLLEAHGIRQPHAPARALKERADHIEPGSEKHMAFLGLIQVEDMEEAKEYGYITHRSQKTNITYRLEDPVTPFMQYPDPMQVARLVLTQKVSSLESGKAKISADAPPLLRHDMVRV